MNTVTPSRSLVLLGTLLATLTACGAEQPDIVDEHETIRNYELLTIVELEDGSSVEFGRLPTGGVVVVEDTPEGAMSPIDTLMTAQQATPLELFLAVAPPEFEVPEALVETHERFAADNGLELAPRALTYAPSDEGFRSQYNWYYQANCSLSADGGWFDNFWQTYNWNWHWYARTNAWETHTEAAGSTNAVQAHLCNDGPTWKHFKVGQYGPGACADAYVFTRLNVSTDWRVQFRVWADNKNCHYWAEADFSGPLNYPWYSLGITKP